MKIQVLGSGCPTCHKLHEMVKEIADEMGKKDTVEYIVGDEGIGKIMELGVMGSPVMVVDGRVAMVGFIPDKNELKKKIYGHI